MIQHISTPQFYSWMIMIRPDTIIYILKLLFTPNILMILMHQNPQKSSTALVEKYTMHQGRNHQPDFFEKVMDQAASCH